jgi:hypothetical protein
VSFWDDDSPVIIRDVLVEDDRPQPTGLLDARGEPLYRRPERHPLGFDTNPDHYRRSARGPQSR